jgi:hypothetical protein
LTLLDIAGDFAENMEEMGKQPQKPLRAGIHGKKCGIREDTLPLPERMPP